MQTFYPTSTQKAPCGPEITEADGKKYIYAIAHGTLTAKTVYGVLVNEYGNVTIAAPSGAVYCYLGVPNETFASGALAKLQIGGYCEDVIVSSLSMAVGEAHAMVAGAITDVAADFTGAVAEFAAACTVTSSADTSDMMLCGHMVLTRAA